LRQPTSFSHTLLVTLLAVALGAPARIGVSGASPDGEPPDTRASAADPCQQVLKAQGNAEGLHRRCEAIGAGGGAARGDFNGDGIADLAIGVPYEDIGGLDAMGAVNVIYGSANGLTPTGILAPADLFITHTTLGLVAPSAGDHLGSALAAGDFNGDGYSDLAVSAPDYDIHGPGSRDGVVVVLNGSAFGLLPSTADHVSSANGALVSARRGAALVWADFNSDGFGDLAIGSPNADVRGDGLFCSEITLDVADAGRVDVVYGSPTGLGPFGLQTLKQGVCEYQFDEAGVGHDSPETGDRFGAALAAMPNAGGGADLVIGAPGEDLGLFDKRDAGVVHILEGGVTGVATSSASTQLISQDTPGVGGAAEDGDQFGRVLATGNFTGNREALVVGIPFEDVGDNAQRDGGAIQVFFRGLPTVTTDDSVFISQSNLANVSAESGDLMGWALAVGDFDFDGRDDLAVGTPGEDVGNTVDAGMVSVLYGASGGLSTTRIQHWHQDSSGILDFVEGGDQFGYALSAWNYGRTRHADLAIGAPFEGVQPDGANPNRIHAGAVHIIYGSGTGLNSSGNQLWTQDTVGINDTAESDDRFGSVLY